MGNKTVHIISHTHWVREWYMPFEKFRMRLVELVDKTLDLLESHESGFNNNAEKDGNFPNGTSLKRQVINR